MRVSSSSTVGWLVGWLAYCVCSSSTFHSRRRRRRRRTVFGTSLTGTRQETILDFHFGGEDNLMLELHCK